MNELIINIIGYIGSFFVGINLIPQIMKILKKQSGKNISYFTIIINIIASILMLIYGSCKKLYPIMISNSLIFISSIIIFCMKKYYKNKQIDNVNKQINCNENISKLELELELEQKV